MAKVSPETIVKALRAQREIERLRLELDRWYAEFWDDLRKGDTYRYDPLHAHILNCLQNLSIEFLELSFKEQDSDSTAECKKLLHTLMREMYDRSQQKDGK